jgi:hypothetical protein
MLKSRGNVPGEAVIREANLAIACIVQRFDTSIPLDSGGKDASSTSAQKAKTNFKRSGENG